MEKKAIAQFKLEDGTEVYFEVPKPKSGSAIQNVGVNIGDVVYKASNTFEEAIDKIQPVAKVVIDRLKTGLTADTDEIEVKFGLNLTADANVVFSSVGGEVSFEVTLKWKKK